MRRIRASWVAFLLLATSSPAWAQSAEPGTPPAPTIVGCSNKRPILATTQTLAANLVINRIDAWVFDWSWARVDFQSWGNNLDRGWKWDGSQYSTNMFVHPLHGSLYFAAARANCMNFWEAIPIVFLGSFTWEYFGERARPALNDFYMTGFGGTILGELLHRFSVALIDEEAEGGERVAREAAALFINPIGGLNRLVRGQWSRQGVNPSDRIPNWYLLQTKLGGRRVEELHSPRGATYSPTLLLEVQMGDIFETRYRAPFDVVHMMAQISPDGGGINVFRTVGRLYGVDLTSSDSWQRHQLVFNQRLDYVNNPVYHFGEQSIEVGLESRWRTGPGRWSIGTWVAGDVVALGAIDALAWDVKRWIDWGPGVGAIAEVSLERDGIKYVSLYNRVRYIRSVSGAPADHTLFFSGLDVTIPITRELGLGAYFSGDRRLSDYTTFPDDERSYVETRIFVTWTPLQSVGR